MQFRMIKLLVALSLVALCAAGAVAEERVLEQGKWYKTLETGFNLSQSAYSDNWRGGDKGSIVWTWLMTGTLENQLSEKTNWLNTLKLAYGQTHQQQVSGDGDRHWDRPEKSTDLVDLESLMRFTMGGAIDPFIAGRFESQFHDGSDPFGRTLALNPMQFKESVGIARQFINEEERSLLSRFGFSMRQHRRSFFTDMDDIDGLDEATESASTNDGGIELVTDYKTRILEDRVAWTTKLDLYQPLFFSGSTDLENIKAADLTAAGLDSDIADYSSAMDIDWENIFSADITEHISVNLYILWAYDKFDNSVGADLDGDGNLLNGGDLKAAVRKAGQFKQTLSLGFNYRLF
jgi:hypothetical protein